MDRLIRGTRWSGPWRCLWTSLLRCVSAFQAELSGSSYLFTWGCSIRLVGICCQGTCMKFWGPGWWGDHGGLGRRTQIIFPFLTSWGARGYCCSCSRRGETHICTTCWRLQETGQWGWSKCIVADKWPWWRIYWRIDPMDPLVSSLVGWDPISWCIGFYYLFDSCEIWMFTWR